jgi:hypothetical protein
LKKGFKVAASAPPGFELLVYRFGTASPPIGFKPDILARAAEYPDGLTIFRSAQCPYTEKNVKGIMKTAGRTFGLTPHLIDLKDFDAVQKCPSPFGTFCILYNGTEIRYHPISNSRFMNIMNKLLYQQ